jgi:hypothetical protein
MKRLLIFWSTILLGGCNYTYTHSNYDSLSFQPEISKEYAFEFMNNEHEPAFMFQIDSTSKASTNAELVVINDSLNHFFVVDKMSCRSWMEGDTLWIHISRSDGFTGHGLNIKIKNGQFRCIPFYSTDRIIPGKKEPSIYVEKQNVVLDRESFQIGDSLYGHVYMRAIVDGRERKYAKGFFRTKIRSDR